MDFNLRSSCSLLLALGASGMVLADEDVFFSELPIVATVSRLPQRQADAPTAVTVIDREIIKASGMRDLNDVLRLVPGFQTFTHNTDPARVSYHGLNDEDFSPRVQVLVDGRSQYSPLFCSGVNWATLPVAIEDIARIEIVRGTNAISYGSNAFMGVINIITLEPVEARGVSVSTTQGNMGISDTTLRAGGKLGEAGDYRFTYQEKNDNGLRDRYDWADWLHSRQFNLRTDFQLSLRDQLQISLGHVDAVMPIGRRDPLSGISKPDWPLHDFRQANTHFQALWRRVENADSEFSLRYAYTRDKASEQAITDDNGVQYSSDPLGGRASRHEIEAQHNLRLDPASRLAWGGSYRLDSLYAPANFYNVGTLNRQTGRIFGNLEWKPEYWLTGNLGSSFEHDSLAGNNFSPRASLAFHLTPENTIRLGYAKATRTGSIFDYRGDQRYIPFAYSNGSPIVPAGSITDIAFYGDRAMPSEKLESFELGYLGDWRKLHMSLDVRAFHEKITDRLFSVSRLLTASGLCENLGAGCVTPEADFTAAAQNVHITGVEYQWRWHPFDGTRLMFSQAFTRIKAEFLPDFLNNPTLSASTLNRINQLATDSAPRQASSLLLMQKLPYGFDLSTSAFRQGKMKWTQNSESNPYTRVDLRLGYPFRLAGQRGEVAVVSQAINGAYGEFKSSGLAADRIVDRRQWLTLRLDFN